jgi:hypothetical protein
MAAGLNIFPVHVTARTTFAAALVKRVPGANWAVPPPSPAGIGPPGETRNRVVELVGEMPSSSAAVLSRTCSRR